MDGNSGPRSGRGPTPLHKPAPLGRRVWANDKRGDGTDPTLGTMHVARKLQRGPDEPLDEFVIRQKKEYLRAANEQRRRLKVLRRALRLHAIDDLELVKGNIPEFETLIASWRIERLLRACPRIGPTRSNAILAEANVPPTAFVKNLSYGKREELARMIDEVRTAYGAG